VPGLRAHREAKAAVDARLTRPVLALLVLLGARPAGAHQGGLSYATIVARGDTVEVTVQATYADWLPVVDLDADHDGTLTAAEVRAQLALLGAFVRRQIQVSADGQACAGEPVDASVAERPGPVTILVRVAYRCPAAVHALRLTALFFQREHPGHRLLATVGAGTTLLTQHVFGPGSETLDLTLEREAQGRTGAVREFLVLGVQHIFTGYDHVLFLIGLLLVAPRLRSLLAIVSAFTAAHTVTLVVATLGWIRVDARLVESVIALSIAYVAIENVIGGEHRRRWLLAFGFGLVHGFGFANVLREMAIPPTLLAWSLASFNVGVELGQVAIVASLYPLLVWSRRQAWSDWAVRGTSVAIGLAGLYWFVERALLAT